MKTHFIPSFLSALLLPLTGFAQVNSGSDGHDGALNPAGNLVIDLADHLRCHVELKPCPVERSETSLTISPSARCQQGK